MTISSKCLRKRGNQMIFFALVAVPALTHCDGSNVSQDNHGALGRSIGETRVQISRDMEGRSTRDTSFLFFWEGPASIRNAHTTPAPLENCQGDCEANRDCASGLYCFQRNEYDEVPGCVDINLDDSNTDYCVHGNPGQLINYGGTPMSHHFPLGECQGDCDKDSDCDVGLVCHQRNRGESIPGCRGGELEMSNSDYCVRENLGSEFLGQCQGGCVFNWDCAQGLYCFHRVGNETVPGCSNGSIDNSHNKFCVDGTPGLLIDYGGNPPFQFFPLGPCQGDCDKDSDCDDGLICFQRNEGDPVPGCLDGDKEQSSSDYCVYPPPTNPPFYLPRPPDGTVTYQPGNLTTLKDNLLLSAGLDAKLLASESDFVQYHNGSLSTVRFHVLPDAGATFIDTRSHNVGGWVYVSNSEDRTLGSGGVGALTFDKDGNLLDYRMVLEHSTWNCGGGKTPWNTWISCEESPQGRIYQVDPFGERAGELTSIGSTIGSWESFAYDVRNPNVPRFFATEDALRGALERFTPSNPDWNDPWSILHGPGVFEYLVLQPDSSGESGTFYWTTDRNFAGNNAAQNYPHTEGIDFYEGQLFFVCKQIKMLYILDLDGGTYQRSSSQSGLFDSQPDQLKRILNSDDGLLYFTEDGGVNAGVHARDDQGRFYTILESLYWPGETTGLAFSPDGKFMYVAYQHVGKLYAVWRRDGFSFGASHLDIKYHDGL